jgi:ankyrin repeat protein
MIINFLKPIHTVIITILLAIACAGCFLAPPKHSAYSPIHEFAASGDLSQVAQDLAANPQDLNLADDAGRTPLHLAAIHCNFGLVDFLLKKGAKIDAKATGDTTPLHLAAQEGCLDVISLLIANGAKVNARDIQGRTPLDRAMEWRQNSAADLIRRHGGLNGTNL